MTRKVIVNSGLPAYVQNISIGPHQLSADESPETGGADAGPNPYELVMAALGACTSMTVRMYAERRNWPLEKVQVDLTFSRLHAADCDDCSRKKGIVNRIEKKITLIGDLSEIQRERLLHMASNCPVHRVLAQTIDISSTLNTENMSAASAEV
jgi:putative redox protein